MLETIVGARGTTEGKKVGLVDPIECPLGPMGPWPLSAIAALWGPWGSHRTHGALRAHVALPAHEALWAHGHIEPTARGRGRPAGLPFFSVCTEAGPT